MFSMNERQELKGFIRNVALKERRQLTLKVGYQFTGYDKACFQYTENMFEKLSVFEIFITGIPSLSLLGFLEKEEN
jgi:hypothetical protein